MRYCLNLYENPRALYFFDDALYIKIGKHTFDFGTIWR